MNAHKFEAYLVSIRVSLGVFIDCIEARDVVDFDYDGSLFELSEIVNRARLASEIIGDKQA